VTPAALRPIPPAVIVAVAAAMLVAMALILAAMGQPWICVCGTVKLWAGDIYSADNSQHIADWYTWTHIIHGFLFYCGLWLIAGRWLPRSYLLLIAILGEIGWEILENSPMIIERYRTTTISDSYTGDSVINSVADVLAMIAGLWLAVRLPVWGSVAIALAIEVVLTLVIRDNLTLNVLMLIWPIEALRAWQAGGG
jgi:hypothetical protein